MATLPFPFRRFPVLLLLTVLAALAARLHGLATEGLFVDELRQAASYAGSWREVTLSAAYQNIPPLDYWIGRLVSSVAAGDFALRLPAALFGALSTALLVLLARRLAGPGPALLAGFAFAFLPFPVHIAQEIRPYSSATCLFLALLLACARVLAQGVNPRSLLLLAGTAFLFLLTRTDGPLLLTVLAVAGTAVALWRGKGGEAGRRGRDALLVLAAGGAAAVAFAPFLWRIARASAHFRQPWGEGEGILSIWGSLSLAPLGKAYFVQLDLSGLVLAPVLVLGVLAAWRARRAEPLAALTAALLLVGPLAHTAVYHLFSRIYLMPAYLFHITPLVLLVSARGMEEAGRWWKKRARGRFPAAPAVAAAILVLTVLVSFTSFSGRVIHEDWKGVCRELEKLPPDNVILMDGVVPLFHHENGFFGFPRYYRPARPAYTVAEVNRMLETPSPVDFALPPRLRAPAASPLGWFLSARRFQSEFPRPEEFLPGPRGLRLNPRVYLEFPLSVQEIGWLLSRPRAERNRLAHLALLPFHRADALASAVPALVLAVYPATGTLTPFFPFQFREEPPRLWGDLPSLASDPEVVLSSFQGFFVVRPARPSGDMQSDLLLLIGKVLPHYPRDSSRVDPLLAALWIERRQGRDTWEERRRQVLEAAAADSIPPGQALEVLEPYLP